MLKKWIKKNFPDQNSITNHAQLRRFKSFLKHSHLWQLGGEAISRGVAVGLFTASVPIVSFQTLMAIILCILLRANFVVAFTVSFISNPFTIAPIAYITFCIGEIILGQYNSTLVIQDVNWKFNNMHEFGASFSNWFHQFGLPFLVGLPVLAFGSACLGYFISIAVWRISKRFKKHT